MNPLNKYLIAIYICLTLTYAFDILENNAETDIIIPQLIMLAFVNISVITVYFSKNWFGQLLLYTNFLLVGLIPLILGIVTIWVKNRKTQTLLKYTCAAIPILLIFFTLIAYAIGSTPAEWKPNFRFVVYRLVQAMYWYTVFMYASIHLKQEYEKIEKKK